ncbi:cytochrome P450 [Aspergillus tetrazonus]
MKIDYDITAYTVSLSQGYSAALLFIPLTLYLLYKYTLATDIPHIKYLPEIPGAVPIFGHLLKLGEDHAAVCEKWWRQYGHSVFQIRLGNTRAGYTIGSSPWDESCRKKRKAAGTALGRPALRNYHPMFDLESYCILRDLYRDSKDGEVEVSVRPYLQRCALNTTLTLCYGIRMDEVYNELLREILYVGSAISLLRSASENLQDYIPLLVPYLLLSRVREMIKKGTDKPCISAAILKDEETKLTGVEVSNGQVWQDRAYEDIKRYYPDLQDAWTAGVTEERVPYINAIIKEAARYYTVSSMSLPRKTVTEINWNGAIIPPKTMVLINAQAGITVRLTLDISPFLHHTDHFGPTGNRFNPERWLSSLDPPTEAPSQGLGHLSFGAGSRNCSGQFIASRLLYAALVRILSSYRIVSSEDAPPKTDYVDYNEIKSALVAIPRDFRVRLVPRDRGVTKACLDAAEVRTRDHYREE